MADGADIGARDQQRRDRQRRNPIENAVQAVNRCHDTADTLNQDQILRPAQGFLGEVHHLAVGDFPPLSCRREIGRNWLRVSPRRDRIDGLQTGRGTDRLEQNSRIGVAQIIISDPAGHRLVGADRPSRLGRRMGDCCRDKSLTNAGTGSGDEQPAHYLSHPRSYRRRRNCGRPQSAFCRRTVGDQRLRVII